jgi:CelD/BcsL family acetyltransferase involved in cellulose biosynthesis
LHESSHLRERELAAIQVAESLIEKHSPAGAQERKARSVHSLSPIEDPRWEEYLSTTPAASVFHSSAWLKALRETYGYEPIAYTTTPPGQSLENGLVFCEVKSGLTGRRLVSVPFSDYCQPLAYNSEDLTALLRAAEAEVSGKGLRYFELRPLLPTGVTRPNWHTAAVYLHHQIDLGSSIEVLFNNLHKNSIQRKIQRAEREGLRYEEGTTESLLDCFYQMMVRTRQRHGVPPQPKRWFRALVEGFGQDLQIRVAFHGSKTVAGMMTIRYKDTLMYKYGGSEVSLNKLGGMHLLYWKSIQDAKKWGLRWFDLGRTDVPQLGLITFKRRWGATESAISYSRYSLDEKAVDSFEVEGPHWKTRTARYFFQHTPSKFLPFLGEILYRHFG